MLKKTSPLLLVLIIGLIYGCGSSNPFVGDIQSNLATNNPDAALELAEQSIQERPGDPIGYYYKGVALGDVADGREATEREEIYRQMNEAFEIAQMVADTSEADTPNDIQQIPNVKNTLWASEFNQGVDYATSDSLLNAVENPFEIALAHMQNATIIQPDSADTWHVMAQLAYEVNDFELAIEAKEKGIELTENPEPTDFADLAAFYANNDDLEGAKAALEKGREQHPTDTDIITNLADLYQQLGQTDEAINTVEFLVEQEPDNPQYRMVLGTHIYQTALNISDEIDENYERIFELQDKLRSASSDSEVEEIEQKIQEIDEENEPLFEEYDNLTDRAIEQLERSIELRPDHPGPYNTLGIIYQNRAAQHFDERNRTLDDNERANELDQQAQEVLRQAMENYEQAAELDPDNQEYWEALLNVYTTLGMDEKADEAMKKAGLDNGNE